MQYRIYIIVRNPSESRQIAKFLWDCDQRLVQTFTSANEAFAAIRMETPDVVIADRLLPDQTGDQLLGQVRLLVPGCLRILMCQPGDTRDRQLLSSAHQYLVKPFGFAELQTKLQRVFQAIELIPSAPLRKRIFALQSLPSIPQNYYKLLQELDRLDSSHQRIVEHLANDGALTAKMLQMANSPLFSSQIVSNLLEALMVLGTERIKALVVSQQLLQTYAGREKSMAILNQMWQHCCLTAHLIRWCCQQAQLSEEETSAGFVAGILHELGLLVLVDNYEQECELMWQKIRAGRNFYDAEQEQFGFTHMELMAFLTVLWGMKESIVDALYYVRQPWLSQVPGFSHITALYLADCVSQQLRFPGQTCKLRREYLEEIQNPIDLEELLKEAQRLLTPDQVLQG